MKGEKNMGLIFDIIDAIIDGIEAIWNAAVKVFKSIVQFFTDVVNWFNKILNPNEEAVLIDLPKLVDDARRKGHVVHVPGVRGNKGVAAATFDPITRKITQLKSIDSDKRDDKTDEILGGRKVVILE